MARYAGQFPGPKEGFRPSTKTSYFFSVSKFNKEWCSVVTLVMVGGNLINKRKKNSNNNKQKNPRKCKKSTHRNPRNHIKKTIQVRK